MHRLDGITFASSQIQVEVNFYGRLYSPHIFFANHAFNYKCFVSEHIPLLYRDLLPVTKIPSYEVVYTCVCVCVCVCVDVWTKSSSSSYRASSTDIPDPLSPLLPIVHRPR